MTNALEIRGLVKRYEGFELGKIDLVLPSGCVMGLVGANGAGKSTTIKLILNMLRRDEGEVRLLGMDARAQSRQIMNEVGVALDEACFPECANARQVGKILAAAYERWEEKTYARYLERLCVPQGQPIKEFSLGMKRKLALAAALSHGARLLILDEALGGVDPVAREDILEIFNQYTRNERNAILISSHIVSDLERISDYVAFLRAGKLLLCEEKDALLERYGVARLSRERFASLGEAAVVGKRVSPYGVEAVVERSAVPADVQVGPVSLEELFVCMARGKGNAGAAA